MEEKRYNIGLCVADITEPFSYRLSKGAMKAAEQLDANLCILPGKYVGKELGTSELSRYEYQHNALLAYAAKAQFDYLIIAAGTIANYLDNDQRSEMFERMSGSPILSISAKVDGYDYIMYDNKSGVANAMEYLIKEQGRKHIGMMVGTLNNYECSERYIAYRQALEKNGIEFKNSYCVPCDLSGHCNKEAEQLIVLNPELDAILCVNDSIAVSVYEVLRKHNKQIGIDISVVGFDDLPFAEKLEPPLASIKADAYKLGFQAIVKAVNYLKGINDENRYVATEFIPRQSCVGQSDVQKSSDAVFAGTREDIPDRFARYFIGSSDVTPVYVVLTTFIASFLKQVEDSLINKKADEEALKAIMNEVDIFFSKNLDIVDNITKVQDIIDSCFAYIFKRIPAENKNSATKLYEYFHKRLAFDIAADYHVLEEKHAERVHNDNVFIRDTLMLAESPHDGYARMLKRLSLIGSDTSFAYIFKEPVVYHYGENFPADPEWKFVGYCYGESCYVVPKDKQSVTTSEIFRNEYTDDDRRHTFIAAVLFIAEYQYGMILCEPTSPDFFDELELVSYELSSVAKMLYLRGKQEQTFMELRSKSLALEGISMTDELTGVYNPGGFYEAAERMVTDSANSGETYVICYADMNDLKRVNDRYGHAEGDFSIKSLAQVLTKLFGENAVIGRLSGDEFAVIALKKHTGELSEIRKRRKEIIQHLNSDSGKPYLITMSIGLLECSCADSYELKENIDKAYGMLFDAKSQKKKNTRAVY